ncbi:MAG: dihydrofolate reductase [Candidatus Eremiobacteraeota bacterium]|nr:dihydrofolate reductase [Candidatus Eremiobacteraeota bacterium]
MARPQIIFVVACDRSDVMGRDGSLPWHLPADLAHFRRLTLDKPVIMGRKTFEAIGKPLPRRLNIVMTRDPGYRAEGTVAARSVEEALAAAGDADQVAVIGGANVFDEFAELVDVVYLTRVAADIPGDTYYNPPRRQEKRSRILGTHEADERNAYSMTFVEIEY